jgi:hypothetical protein
MFDWSAYLALTEELAKRDEDAHWYATVATQIERQATLIKTLRKPVLQRDARGGAQWRPEYTIDAQRSWCDQFENQNTER